jgi:hypothetical protein
LPDGTAHLVDLNEVEQSIRVLLELLLLPALLTAFLVLEIVPRSLFQEVRRKARWESLLERLQPSVIE